MKDFIGKLQRKDGNRGCGAPPFTGKEKSKREAKWRESVKLRLSLQQLKEVR